MNFIIYIYITSIFCGLLQKPELGPQWFDHIWIIFKNIRTLCISRLRANDDGSKEFLACPCQIDNNKNGVSQKIQGRRNFLNYGGDKTSDLFIFIFTQPFRFEQQEKLTQKWLKVRQFQNEFNIYEVIVFWEKRWLHKFILKLSDL